MITIKYNENHKYNKSILYWGAGMAQWLSIYLPRRPPTNTCPFIYRTYHTGSHGGLQFCKEPEDEIGRQLIEGASG